MITNSNAENSLREILKAEGYSLTPHRTNGENGVDIIAEKQNNKIFIEVIGYKKTGAARSKDFCEVFFRAISRLKDGAEKLVIALPMEFKVGIKQRTDKQEVSWSRIGDAFPELNVWFIDTTNNKLDTYSWNQLAEI
jgi:Holliday junction resolvase-like predicted endonuclease